MTTTAEMTVEEMRAEYAILRRNAGISAMRADWTAAVVAVLGGRGIDRCEATPAEWLEAARDTRTTCDRCQGTGIYAWGGTVNGKSVHTGDCYRCEGHGTQGQDDYRRNYGHTLHMIASAIA